VPGSVHGGQSDTGSRFSPSSSVFPCRYHSAMSIYTRNLRDDRPVGDHSSETHSHASKYHKNESRLNDDNDDPVLSFKSSLLFPLHFDQCNRYDQLLLQVSLQLRASTLDM
jgi:hypothetical protein